MANEFKPAFEVRNEAVEAKLREIGRMLKKSVDEVPGCGFCLWLFSYGEGGDMFYLSSARREDVMRMLDEFKAKCRQN